MDLDEWEYLPDDGFLDYHEDGGKKISPSRRNSDTKSVFNMNYFICPATDSMKITNPTGNSRVPSTNQLVPVRIPIQLEQQALGKSRDDGDDHLEKEITKVPIEISAVRSATSEKVMAPSNYTGALEADQDTVSQVFFKKMNENEFVEMKMDSPKSPTRGGGGFVPQIDSGAFHFDEKDDHHQGLENKSSPRMKNNSEATDNKEEASWDGQDSDGGLNLWKWSSTGIGAICSFGIAAATICILFFGSQQKNKQQQQNQKLRFQIYADDKVSQI